MDKNALVSLDIESGREVVNALDRAGKSPKVALWAKLPEYDDWRLIIASDRLAQGGSLPGYSELNSALEQAGIPLRRRPVVSLVSMNKPFIRALRRVFGNTADVSGMRLGGQTFGDQFLEDAFVYRIQ